jgi:hypothetical protein
MKDCRCVNRQKVETNIELIVEETEVTIVGGFFLHCPDCDEALLPASIKAEVRAAITEQKIRHPKSRSLYLNLLGK